MAEIRKVKETDRDEYMRMRMSLWPECAVERHELEIGMILSSSGVVFVAEVSESNLAGFAEISIRGDQVEGSTESPVPYLEGWYVDPEFRGKGIGKALILSAEDFASEKGFKELASDTELSNKPSLEIHKKIGFTEVGRTVHFVKKIK